MQYQYTPMRMAKMKKKIIVDKVVENLELPHTAGGNVNLHKHTGMSAKAAHIGISQSCFFIPRYTCILSRNVHIRSQKDVPSICNS